MKGMPASSNIGHVLEVPVSVFHDQCRFFPVVGMIDSEFVVLSCCQQTATVNGVKGDCTTATKDIQIDD